MSDRSNDLIRRKALRAARAVTMGAALMAAGCSSDAEEPRSSSGGWGIGERDDATVDASVDAADPTDVADASVDAAAPTDVADASVDAADPTDVADASVDAADPTDVAPDVIAEVGPTCSEGFDQICPEGCEPEDDADCCERDELCSWYGGEPIGCGCAVPGPFVPPSMIV